MARGQLARISKHKIRGEEHCSTIAEGLIKCSKCIKKATVVFIGAEATIKTNIFQKELC